MNGVRSSLVPPADNRVSMEIAVCVATYRRPDGLRTLLESLVTQKGLDGRFGIIIVDNDADGSARAVVDEFRSAGPEIIYAVEADPGIPAARNRSVECARTAGASAVAFIDDDEAATPYWLATLMNRMRISGASAVSGPVEPVLPARTPEWARISRLYNRATFPDGAEIDYASTANSLLRLDTIHGDTAPFDMTFRYSGGSDTRLFHSLRARGGTIVWEPNALIYEFVPESRISMRWLIARSYRHGITLARCDRLVYRSRRKSISRGVRGMAQVPLGIFEVARSLARQNQAWRRGITRVARGIGTLAGLSGAIYEEYQRD
jgi:succinoglycan biosynthesis protein ExoM